MSTQKKEQTFSEIDLVQSLCRESFFEFVKEFWHIIIPEVPVWNWHIPYLCNELQAVGERVLARKRKLHDLNINIPPGTTKSTICSIMFPAWLWARDPSIRCITASFEQLLALNFARRSRDIITSPLYQAAFRFKKDNKGKWKPSTDKDAIPIELRDDQNTKGFYENMAHGDRKSVGSEGNITGSHAHIILVDDPINPKEAISTAGLKAVNVWMNETLPSRKVDKENAPTILIMQRLHQGDPSAEMRKKGIKRGGVKNICLPGELTDQVEPASLKKHYKNGLLDAVRLNHNVLKEMRADMGEFGYSGQVLQNPVPLGGGMFKVLKIKHRPLPPMSEFVTVVRGWDKGGTDGGGDFSAGVKLGKHKTGSYWILDVIKGQWDSGEREQHIKSTAEADGRSVIVVIEQEPGSGGKQSAQQSAIMLAGWMVRVIRPSGDKALRADPFSVQVNVGNVYVPEGAAWWDDYKSEMNFFPFAIHDDQVDATSVGFNQITKIKLTVGAM